MNIKTLSQVPIDTNIYCYWKTLKKHKNMHKMTTQPSVRLGSVNEDQLLLGRKRQVRFILLADERDTCR